jgi:hypothetical protein
VRRLAVGSNRLLAALHVRAEDEVLGLHDGTHGLFELGPDGFVLRLEI